MRIRSAVAAVATLALTAGVMSSAAADAGDPATPPAAPAEDGTGADSADEPGVEVAEQALADAQALLDEDPATQPVVDRDATIALRDLAAHRDLLGRSQRSSADRLLARPGAQRVKCGRATCVHWTSTGSHAPSPVDASPANGVPDFVDSTLATMERVHRTYVRAGYRAPLKDRGRGGNRKRDVYLRNIGGAGPVRLLHHRPEAAHAARQRVGLLRARQRLLPGRVPDEHAAGEHAGDRRPRVLPRGAVRLRLPRGRLVHGGHGHLGRGRALRRRQRQLQLPAREPDPADPEAPRRLPRLERLRQLDLLPLPHRADGQEQGRDAGHRPQHVAQGRRQARRARPVLHPGDQERPEEQAPQLRQDVRELRRARTAAPTRRTTRARASTTRSRRPGPSPT